MSLSDDELESLFVVFKRADLGQLVSLSTLLQSMIEIVVKEEQEKLSVIINKVEVQKWSLNLVIRLNLGILFLVVFMEK